LKQAEKSSELFSGATEVESQQLAGQSLAFLLMDSKNPDAAQGLPLLPLVSGTTIAVGSAPAVAATEKERRLLKGNDNDLLAIPTAKALLASSITDVQLQRPKLFRFSLERLARALPQIVPPSWERQRQVDWSSDFMASPEAIKAAEASGRSMPVTVSVEWLNDLFDYLSEAPPPESQQTPDQFTDSRCGCLNNWPLLPIQTQQLLTMRARKAVLHSAVFDSENATVVAIAQELVQMGIPVVDPAWSSATAAFTGDQAPLPSATDDGLGYFLAKIKATSMLDLWQPAFMQDTAAFRAAATMLHYLSVRAMTLEDDDVLRQTLLKVPMFLTADMTARVPFINVKAIDMATANTTDVEDPRRFVVIEPETSALFSYLRVEIEDRSALLRDHILPRLPGMTPEERCQALATLAPEWQAHRETLSELPGVLRNLPCLLACNDEYVTARELVDDRRCKVFEHVYKHRPDRRLNPRYSNDEWKPLLKDLGVGMEMTSPRFLECAQVLCHEWDERFSSDDPAGLATDLEYTAER
jgi:hypothetical protein